jgi:hypothetical protein
MPAFLMGAIGGIGNAIGGIASALGSVVSTIGGILQTAAKLVMGAVQSIAKGLMAIGGLLVRGAMMFVGMMFKATQGAMAYAKSVNDLRLSTGMGMKEAGATSAKFGAFGISAQMLGQARGNEHHSITKMRAAAWDVDPNDPMSINRKARSFGDSLAGHAQREAMLESVGMNNDKGRWMASLSEEQMQDQLNFTQKTGAALGISPESMSKIAEVLPLAQAKLESFVQLIQLKFVDTAMPAMEQGISAISDFISQNAPMIAEVFSTAVGWIFREGPKFILTLAVQFLGLLSNLVGGMAQVTQWLADNASQVLQIFENILNGIRKFVALAISIANAFRPKKKKEEEGEVTPDTQTKAEIQQAASAAIAQGPLQQSSIMGKPFDPLKKEALGVALTPEKVQAVKEAEAGQKKRPVQQFFDTVPEAKLAQYKDGFKETMTNASTSLLDKQKSIDDTKSALEKQLNAFGQKELKAPDKDAGQKLNTAQERIGVAQTKVQIGGETNSVFATMGEELSAIRKASEKTAENTNVKNIKANTPGVQDWLGRFAQERSRQRYLMETR